MKKFLNSIIIIMILMFVGMISVNAQASISKGINNNYTFSWQNLTFDVNNDYKLECSNARINDGDMDVKNHPSGSVTFTPNSNSTTVRCRIYKDDAGNPELASAEITIGTTKPSTTSSTTSQQTTTATTTPKSNNANLKTLVVKTSDNSIIELTPSFSASVTEYNATVPSNVKTINIETTMEDSKASVILSKNATEELIPGENNKITITVTAEDGTKRAYVLNIKREALTADATLRSLIIKESKKFKLIKDKYTYNVKVDNNVKQLTLDIETTDDTAIYEIEGNEDLKDGSAVKITVTAQDGTKKVYTLNISKVSTTTKSKVTVDAEKNPLIIMGLSIIAFGLIGGIIYYIKK